MVTQAQQAKHAANQQGGIIDKEAPIDLSNVMYLYKGKPVTSWLPE